MRTGTYWIYRGTVAWQVSGEGDKVHRSQLDWRMEVLDSVRRGRYKVALLRGHPKDLTWYTGDRKRGCHILVGVDDQEFYLNECAPTASREKLMLSESDIAALTDGQRLIFKFPLRQGDVFGGDPERGIHDGMYEWCVDVRSAVPVEIGRIAPGGRRTAYVLTYRTNPDHEVDTYVPGIGLTAYSYSHHGTVSDVDFKLVEFHQPGTSTGRLTQR